MSNEYLHDDDSHKSRRIFAAESPLRSVSVLVEMMSEQIDQGVCILQSDGLEMFQAQKELKEKQLDALRKEVGRLVRFCGLSGEDVEEDGNVLESYIDASEQVRLCWEAFTAYANGVVNCEGRGLTMCSNIRIVLVHLHNRLTLPANVPWPMNKRMPEFMAYDITP